MSVARYEVEIDLGQVEQAKLADPKQYFHQSLYSSLVSQVRLQAQKSEQIQRSNQPDDINQTRSHDAILLDGPRGYGKTSILVNLRNYMQSQESEEIRNLQQTILFLNPVDPTLLNEKEDFLNIVLGQINSSEEVLNARDRARQQHADAYERSLDELANAMEGEQTLKERVGLDRILSYQGGLEITKYVHAFFNEVLRLTGKKLILLPIDDVDMSLKQGMNVLEVVRKYLCSPHFLPIVSGDRHLYQELVNNYFARALVDSSRGEPANQMLRGEAENLAKEYLRKVFPIHNRHTVPSVASYLHGRTANGSILAATVRNAAHNPLIDLTSLGYLVHAALNGRVNGDEQSAVDVSIPTARQLIQFLKSLENVLSQMLKESKQKNEAMTLVFQSRTDAVRWWLQQSKQTAEAFYLALATYFNYTQNLRLQHLCEALMKLNLPSAQADMELGKLAYLSLEQQMEMNLLELPKRQSETYALYKSGEWVAAQFERLHETFKRAEIYTLAPLPAIEPLDQKLKFTRAWKAIGNEDQFLLELLTHSDFYSSYQVAPLVFFGKFFELITTSLMRDIDGKWLQSLLNRPPYYSIFDLSSTKTFDLDDDILADPSDEPPQTSTSKLSTDYIDGVANRINTFRKDAGLDGVGFVDISIIHAVQSKFFNQVNLLKKAGHVRTGKKALRNDEVPNTSTILLELARRAMYTYWSALGSFELSELYFSTPPKVAHQNYASVHQIALGAPDNNPGYLLNIKPFLELKSDFASGSAPMTKLISTHPVFEMITTFAEAVEAMPRATMTGRSNITANPEVTSTAATAPDLAIRRPKYYNALSILTRKHFSQTQFNSCMKAYKEHRYGPIHEVIRAVLPELGRLTLEATHNDESAAIGLLASIGYCIKEGQFFNQRTRLDKFLMVLSIGANSLNVDLTNRSKVTKYLREFGAMPRVVESIGKGI